MKHAKIAAYAGSFDPFTNGHFWMAQTAMKMFDFVWIFVAENPNKHCKFSVQQRKSMIQDSLIDKNKGNFSVTEIKQEFLAKLAKKWKLIIYCEAFAMARISIMNRLYVG